MTYEQFKKLKVGDVVTPIGNTKDKGRLFMVVDFYINEMGVVVEPICGKVTPTTYDDFTAKIKGNRRGYRYQALKIKEEWAE